ncbi:DUF948 domain-containing protein [Bacillus sp. RD4P76]|uniref:DUF948 domain-containing protein n=1 Tax=Bacillus suaedaesalsae TaxID=2810349 RepID=A0ABS2DD87_9BACI|nr:DUF948 domain-containing protein [Bacillus suaedaesalsae]
MNLLYVSVAIIAISFLILAIYISKTLLAVRRSLDQMSTTVSDLEKQMRGVTRETTELLAKTNQLADDIQQKSESLNTVVQAVKEIGDSLQRFSGSIKNVTSTIQHKAEQNGDKITQAVQWGNVAVELWDKLKQRKNNRIYRTEVDE